MQFLGSRTRIELIRCLLQGTAVYAIISVFSFRAASDTFMARIAVSAMQNATVITPVDEEAISAFSEVLCTFYR